MPIRFTGCIPPLEPSPLGAQNDVVPSPEPPVRLKWYYRPIWVLVLLFLVLGPLGIPYLWKSKGFSQRSKIILTVLVLAYTALLVEEVIRAFRVAEKELNGFDIDF